MSWVRIDDEFEDNPKVKPLSDGAHRVWLMANCWCKKPTNLRTNGFVPASQLPSITNNRYKPGQLKKLVDELVGANVGGTKEHGLWEPRDGGWQFHDWQKYLSKDDLRELESGRPTMSRQEAARVAGLRSAESRRASFGTAQPKRSNDVPNDSQRRSETFDRTSTERPRTPDPVPDPDRNQYESPKDLTGTQRADRPPDTRVDNFAKSFDTECPEIIEFTGVHARVARTCGEPIDELWADFRAKRRAKGVKAAMPLGWSSDFEGWLRSFARNKRERDARNNAPPVNEYPGADRKRGEDAPAVPLAPKLRSIPKRPRPPPSEAVRAGLAALEALEVQDANTES